MPRDWFALAEGLVYLNHAAAGPLPIRTRDVLFEAVEAQARAGVLGVWEIERRLDYYHERIGRFIGARGDEIAFLRNTSDGANVVAQGLDWRDGDEVILSDNEFGANALPWVSLRRRGVVPRFIATRERRLTPAVLAREITPRTRVVAVSWVSFSDGYRHDLAGLAEVAHAHGALLCVDAMQGLGAFGLDVKQSGIDALYAGGAKWLLSPPGISFVYVDAPLRDRLSVHWRGWRDVQDIWDFLDYDQPLAKSAARFEGGTPNFLGLAALATSMDVLEEAGIARITDYVLALTDHLVESLRSAGAEVLSVRGEGCSSGIVTFALPGTDPIALGKRLGQEKIVTTYRPTGIRVSPHGHNPRSDIDALIEALG